MKKNVLILVGLCILGLFLWQIQAANVENICSINKWSRLEPFKVQ